MTFQINTVLQMQLMSSTMAFEAKVHGMDRNGVLDVEFDNMTMAARYVHSYRIADKTTIHQTNTDANGNVVWHRPVVLSIDLKLPATAG